MKPNFAGDTTSLYRNLGSFTFDEQAFQSGLGRNTRFLGWGAGQNIALRQARGRYVVLLDTSVELNGDALSRLGELLDDPSIGIAGRWGVTTNDLRTFEEAPDSGLARGGRYNCGLCVDDVRDE